MHTTSNAWNAGSNGEAYVDILYDTAVYTTRPHIFPVLRGKSGQNNTNDIVDNLAINQVVEITSGFRVFIFRINNGNNSSFVASLNANGGVFVEYTLIRA